MALKPFHKLILLPLLLVSFAAAPQRVEEAAYQEAATLCDGGHWGAAQAYIDAALQRFQGSDADAVWRLRMLLGKVLVARSDPKAAIVLLTPSLPRRLRQSDIEVRRLTYLAGANYRIMNDGAAEPLLIRAERLARKRHPAIVSEVLLYRANFEFHRKRYANTMRYARAAVAAARPYHQFVVQINATMAGANALTEQEHYDEAIDLYLKELARVPATGAEATIVKAKGNLAWAYVSIGDLENASALLADAIPLARKLNADYDLLALLNLAGDVARLRGDKKTALQNYAESFPLIQAVNHRDLADFAANLAVAQLETGDLTAARLTNDQASTLTRERGDDKQLFRTRLIDARIDVLEGQLASAIEKAQRVLNFQNIKPSQRWEAEARLAQFHVAANHFADADAHFRRAIETADDARRDVKSDELRLPFGTLIREVY